MRAAVNVAAKVCGVNAVALVVEHRYREGMQRIKALTLLPVQVTEFVVSVVSEKEQDCGVMIEGYDQRTDRCGRNPRSVGVPGQIILATLLERGSACGAGVHDSRIAVVI
jgi:hypothetical protein